MGMFSFSLNLWMQLDELRHSVSPTRSAKPKCTRHGETCTASIMAFNINPSSRVAIIFGHGPGALLVLQESHMEVGVKRARLRGGQGEEV